MPSTVFLTSAHPPFDTRVFQKEARSLAREGMDVTLVVPHTRHETVDGVKVVAVRKAGGRWTRWLFGPWRVLAAAWPLRADVYHLQDPELLPIGLVLKCFGRRVIFDIHEDVPKDLMGKPYIPRLLRGPLSWAFARIQRVATRAFDHVILAREDIRPTLGRHPRVTVISNYPELAGFGKAVARPPRDPAAPFTVIYFGAISARRGLFEMMDAIGRVAATRPARLRVFGHFSPAELEAAARRHPAWPCVEYGGQVAYPELPGLAADADVGIVCFLPDPNHVNSGPTKLFEYMALGLPVIASDFPEWRAVIDGASCGICVDPDDPADIARAMTRLAADPEERKRMGAAGRAAIESTYNWEVETVRLLSAYRSVLER